MKIKIKNKLRYGLGLLAMTAPLIYVISCASTSDEAAIDKSTKTSGDNKNTNDIANNEQKSKQIIDDLNSFLKTIKLIGDVNKQVSDIANDDLKTMIKTSWGNNWPANATININERHNNDKTGSITFAVSVSVGAKTTNTVKVVISQFKKISPTQKRIVSDEDYKIDSLSSNQRIKKSLLIFNYYATRNSFNANQPNIYPSDFYYQYKDMETLISQWLVKDIFGGSLVEKISIWVKGQDQFPSDIRFEYEKFTQNKSKGILYAHFRIYDDQNYEKSSDTYEIAISGFKPDPSENTENFQRVTTGGEIYVYNNGN